MFEDLRGKTALVTGASSGLGLHFSRLLARQGMDVVLAARRQTALDQVAAAIIADGGRARSVALDVTDPGSIATLMDRIGASPDVLINNAGISGDGRAIELPVETWDQVMETNLRGPFLLAQTVARGMKQAGKGGAIVNIASIAGLRTAGGLSVYGASKAGLIQLTKSLALEWARDAIRVNALCPGYIETDINRDFFATEAGQQLVRRIPQRRLGQPSDLDGALLLLASDAGRYITGSTIEVDGGHLVSSL